MKKLLGKAPIFPLPHGALLPGELLPLHVFEPRYRVMLEAVRTGDKTLAVATLAPGWETDYQGTPPLEPIVGVGRLVRDRKNPDGTSDIVLQGLVRARIARELPGRVYREGLLELCPGEEEHPAVTFRRRRKLLEGLARRLGGRELGCDVTAEVDSSRLADRIAAGLELDPAERVLVLQTLDADGRVELLLELLGEERHGERLAEIIPDLGDFSLSLPDGPDPAP